MTCPIQKYLNLLVLMLHAEFCTKNQKLHIFHKGYLVNKFIINDIFAVYASNLQLDSCSH